MKKTFFTILLFFLLFSCKIPPENILNNSIGIQEKKDQKSFIYNISAYDFTKKWVYHLEKYKNKNNELIMDFAILNNTNEKGIECGYVYKGIVITIDKNNISKFKNSMINGGDFQAYYYKNKIKTKIGETTKTTDGSKFNINIKKIQNKDKYVFFDTDIYTVKIDNQGKIIGNKKSSKKVSFAINILNFKNKFKNTEKEFKKAKKY